MTSKSGMKALILSAAFVLLGAGCTGFQGISETPKDLPVETGDSVSEQADIVVDDVLGSIDAEVDALEGDDSDLFDEDQNELNNLENSYDEDQL